MDASVKRLARATGVVSRAMIVALRYLLGYVNASPDERKFAGKTIRQEVSRFLRSEQLEENPNTRRQEGLYPLVPTQPVPLEPLKLGSGRSKQDALEIIRKKIDEVIGKPRLRSPTPSFKDALEILRKRSK